MRTLNFILLAGMAAALAGCPGCQADPKSWHGGQKFLNIYAVAFTPSGKGLMMVGPRRGGSDQPNATSYYYFYLPTMTGLRLGHGQYSLGQALVSPFNEWAAIPVYFASADHGAARTGYELYDLTSGQLLRRVAIADPELFVPNPGDTTHPAGSGSGSLASQPDQANEVAVWRKISPDALSARQVDLIKGDHPRWLTRGSKSDRAAKIETVDGQRFYVLDSPDKRHRLYLRFQAPGNDPLIANDPDGDGYAYGFLLDVELGKRYMLYTTTGADEFFDSVGSAVIGGPVWLVKQPAKWFRGR